jgi:hypothetical protein
MSDVITLHPYQPAMPDNPTTMDLINVAAALTSFILYLDEDPTEEQREWLREQLFALKHEAPQKARALNYVISDMAAKAEFLRVEETRIARKRKRLLDEAESLKRLTTELLLAHKDVTGSKSLEWETGKATLRTSTRVCVPSVEELARLCPDLVEVKTSTVPDKVAIKADLKKHPERNIPAKLVESHWTLFT